MRAAITGPTGAIGHALIEECLKQNMEVLAICRKKSMRTEKLCKRFSEDKGLTNGGKIKFLYLDLDEYKNYVNQIQTKNSDKIGEFCDVFFHLSWMGTTGKDRDDRELQSKNVEYALSAVRLAKALGCHTFVGAGSQAEYGRVQGVLSAKTETNPETEYGRAKLEAGVKTRELCKELGMKHIWTRILSVYGPYDGEGSMIMQAIRNMQTGAEAKFTKGEQQWDYLYSEDAAEALLLLGQKGVDGQIYPLGSGKTKRLSEYIAAIRSVVNPNAKIDLGAVPYAEKQVMYLCADISKLTRDTGFVPHTEFEDGIRNIIKRLEED